MTERVGQHVTLPVMEQMMQEIPEIRYAKSNELNLAYQCFGEGPGSIVFIPGILNHIETTWAIPEFAQFCRRLAAFSRVVLFDKLGTGLSDRLPPGDRPTLERRIDDIVAVMTAARLKKAALFGTADGGPGAAMFAATYPDALILYGSWPRLSTAEDYPFGHPRTALEGSLKMVEQRWGNEAEPLFLRRVAPSLLHDAQWGHTLARMERLAASPSVAVSLHRIMFETDIRAILPTIRVPTLVLHTSGDQIFSVEHGRYLARHIPGARLVELDGVDHFPFHENGATLADLIQEFLTGTRPDIEIERVLATLLFIDIVGSTQKVAEIGDHRWAELLEEYRERSRIEITRHRGVVVDTAGDGLLTTFSGPGRAIRCAAAIREGMRPLGLDVRAGVHTGEIETKKNRVAGIAVHIGARVASLADPGEILVSRTVKDLVAGSGITFLDRGTHNLKGVPGTWDLFAAQF
jgi:pimeloyl-ACP methyl ester carboxylesterase